MQKKVHKCSVCGKEVLPLPENKAFPFCCARCKRVDLGKWLGEEYRLRGPDEDLLN